MSLFTQPGTKLTATFPSLPHFRPQLSSAFGGNLEPKCCRQFPLPFRNNDFCECDRERATLLH